MDEFSVIAIVCSLVEQVKFALYSAYANAQRIVLGISWTRISVPASCTLGRKPVGTSEWPAAQIWSQSLKQTFEGC